MPTARQSVTSIQKLIHDLESENLNVAEKLQIVNLVPQTIIEMVVVSFVFILPSLALILTPVQT